MPTPKLKDDVLALTIEAYMRNGQNQNATARDLGISRSTLQSRLAIAKARFENPERAFAPLADTDARDGVAPYLVKGVSTLLGPDGDVKAQWIKTKLDDEYRLAMVESAIAERAERIEPLPPIPLRETSLDYEAQPHRLNFVTLTDCHIGMLAWDKESGEDWDINIARDTLIRTFVGLIRSAPPADMCIINQQGDFLHFDGLKPVTPAHGHVLDADTRYQKLAGVGADVLEQLVIEALTRHKRVRLILAEGNHDESGSVWLRVMFRRLFRDNPRVEIDDSPLPYYAYRHGKTLIGVHHGHLSKITELPGLFAAEPRFRQDWGLSTRTYIHCGHYHQHEIIEKNGAEVERHPTLAARDAYAARGGYVSDRRAFLITYSDEHGEVGRISATPETYG